MNRALPALLATVLLAGCLSGASLSPFGATNSDSAITVSQVNDAYSFSVDAKPGVSYTWYFGDLSPPATGAVVEHTYRVRNGQFPVLLVASSASGLQFDGYHLTIGNGVDAVPQASFTIPAAEVQTGAPFHVDGSASSDPDGDPVLAEWVLAPAGSASAATASGGSAAMAMPGMVMTGLPDSGAIGPGASATVTYAQPGMYQIACTMHPWTVGKVYTDPTEANTTATVLITNFAFYPPIVHIAPGGTVTFVNRDTTSHTAYGMAFVPVGTILPLTDASGTISVATAGRYDLTLAIADGHGQMATATHSLEVADHVPASIKEFNFSGTYGSPAAVQGGMLLQAKPQNFTFHVPAVSTLYANSTQGSATSHGTLQFAIVASDGQTLFRGSSMHGLVEPGVYTLEVNSSDPLIVSVPWTSHIFLDMMPAAESARSM